MKRGIIIIFILIASIVSAQGQRWIDVDGTSRDYWKIGKNAGQLKWLNDSSLYQLKWWDGSAFDSTQFVYTKNPRGNNLFQDILGRKWFKTVVRIDTMEYQTIHRGYLSYKYLVPYSEYESLFTLPTISSLNNWTGTNHLFAYVNPSGQRRLIFGKSVGIGPGITVWDTLAYKSDISIAGFDTSKAYTVTNNWTFDGGGKEVLISNERLRFDTGSSLVLPTGSAQDYGGEIFYQTYRVKYWDDNSEVYRTLANLDDTTSTLATRYWVNTNFPKLSTSNTWTGATNTYTGRLTFSGSGSEFVLPSQTSAAGGLYAFWNSSLGENNIGFQYDLGSWQKDTVATLRSGRATFPLKNGTGATGTWGINISGNAATVTNGVYTSGSYSNPSWITSLAWSKISSTPTTLSGYGITDAVPSSRTLTINGTTYDLSANRSWTISGGSGTVTSVAMTVPTGFQISGSPITTSGTLGLSFASGYSLPTNASQSNWDTAYGWGNHASAGYATASNTMTFTNKTWNGNTIGISYGGTNNTSFSTNKLVYYDGSKLASTTLDAGSFYLSGLFDPTYGELYDNIASSTISTNGSTYVKWTGSTIGKCANITGNTTNDNLTINSGYGGVYVVSYSVSFSVSATDNYYWAININGSAEGKTRSMVYATTTGTYTASATAIVDLSSLDTIDLGCFSTSGRTVTVVYANLNIRKISN